MELVPTVLTYTAILMPSRLASRQSCQMMFKYACFHSQRISPCFCQSQNFKSFPTSPTACTAYPSITCMMPLSFPGIPHLRLLHHLYVRGGVPGPPRHSDRLSLIAFVCSDHSYLRVYGALVTELPRGRKGEWGKDSVPEGLPIQQGNTGV